MCLTVMPVKSFTNNAVTIYQYSTYHWVGCHISCPHPGQLQATVHIFFIICQSAKVRIKK